MADLSVNICGVAMKNPVIAASGTFGFGREYDRYYDISKLGGISVKGLTLEKREGNPPVRIAETPGGMLNAVGLQNPGVDAFLRDDLPWLLAKDIAVLANIAGNSLEEYEEMARRLRGSGVHLIELNISCPNVKQGGVAFGTDACNVRAVTEAVKKQADVPVIVKLTPNVTSIADMATAAVDGGADGVSLINTITGMAVDAYARKPVIANRTGGLSGPCIKPVALRMVYEVAQAVDVPVIGMGGIVTGEDAVEFLLCGVEAVMVGTANIMDVMACPRIIGEIGQYMEKMDYARISDIVGGLIV